MASQRFEGIKRVYTKHDVEKLRGSIKIEHTLARLGAERLWELLHAEPYIPALGALTGEAPQPKVELCKHVISCYDDNPCNSLNSWSRARRILPAGTSYRHFTGFPMLQHHQINYNICHDDFTMRKIAPSEPIICYEAVLRRPGKCLGLFTLDALLSYHLKIYQHDITHNIFSSLSHISGTQAVQQVQAGLKAIYLSGWQVAADANTALQTYPDQSLYPVDSVPKVRTA